jgi:hypothetical protein
MLVLGSETRKTEVRFKAGAGIFIFATVSRLVLRLTQRPIQWASGGALRWHKDNRSIDQYLHATYASSWYDA